MSHAQDPTPDLQIARAMVDEFENYLLEDSLYRQLRVETSAGDRMPKMSAGSLLAALRDLDYAENAGELTSDQAAQLAELTTTFGQLRKRHESSYRAKLARELKSQIDSWRWFLQDCRDDPARCREEYPFEVWIRNRIALLVDELGGQVPAEQQSRLQALDRDLRDVFVSGDFVLDDALKGRFPKNRYWWLYGQPEAAG